MDCYLIDKTKACFVEKYGDAPQVVSYAPGRVEVLGNHTDYNEGTVFSAAINMGHCFCVSRSSVPGIRVFAIDLDEVAVFEANDMEKVPNKGWANYIKGVIYYLQDLLGEKIDGLECAFSGSIPMGAGLSSSAALEVATAYAVLGLLGKTADKKEIGKLSREAECNFAGANCGLLDQFSSIFGVEHGLIHSDFRNLEITSVQLPADVEFLMINPMVKHALVDSPYNERRERCEQAAVQFAEILDHPVAALRDVSWEEFESNKDKIDEAAAKRAAHVVGEITRVEKGVDLLAKGKIEAFGQFLFDSHESSIHNFENSCPELDIVVAAAREAGALGARLSGGGFGGSAVALVRAQGAQAVADKIMEICAEKGLNPSIEVLAPSAGAKIVESNVEAGRVRL